MRVFRVLLVIMTLTLVVLTVTAVNNQGWNLVGVFAENVSALSWSGQFNMDFACYLILSALWIMWRHKFSLPGIGFGLIAGVAGILFLAPYLLAVSLISKGDVKGVLLGKRGFVDEDAAVGGA